MPVKAVLDLQLSGAGHWTTGTLGAEGVAYFLSQMAEAWNKLNVEETYPMEARPENPSELQGFLRSSSSSRGSAVIELEIERFRRVHDVAAWLPKGTDRPSLWLMREGQLMIAEVSPVVRRLPLTDALWSLERLGEMLAKQLLASKGFQDAVEIWRNRYATDELGLKQLFVSQFGQSEERINELVEARVVTFPKKRAEIIRGLDEVSAAARMAPTSTSTSSLASIAGEIRRVSRTLSEELDLLAKRASLLLFEKVDLEIRGQAINLAKWLRAELHLREHDRAEPAELLARWNVAIRNVDMPASIEAVSFWGEQHGPGILLNPKSQRSQRGANLETGATRFTLSHEICHLLVDRAGALPVAEVLDRRASSTPRAAEHRADIFACHFLLPLEAAADEYRRSDSLQSCISRLTHHFGVTESLAKFQLWWRGYDGNLLRPDDYQELKRFSDPRQRSARQSSTRLF
jgi:Zn-dependent peptidase ImmA (M78 family)